MIVLSRIMDFENDFHFGKEWLARLRKIYFGFERQAIPSRPQLRFAQQVCNSSVLVRDSAGKLLPTAIGVQVE